MTFKKGFVGLALVMILSGSLYFVPKILAQNDSSSSTYATKRKVRSKVAPEYPDLARQLNITGKVKIEVTISPDGHVAGTKVVGGNPLLVSAAQDALKRWRFESGPKETSEVIEFQFNGSN